MYIYPPPAGPAPGLRPERLRLRQLLRPLLYVNMYYIYIYIYIYIYYGERERDR